MRSTLRSSGLFFLSLMWLFTGCQRSEPIPQAPVLTDPATIVEGIYVGGISAVSATKIHQWGPDGVIVMKQVAPGEIEIHSLFGELTPYRLKLYVKGDSILSPDSEPLIFGAKFRMKFSSGVMQNKPVEMIINRRDYTTYRPNAIELNSFDWVENSGYQPLSMYRSPKPLPAESISLRLAGLYTAPGIFSYQNQEYKSGELIIRPTQANVIEILNRQGGFGPYQVTLHQQAPGEWEGVSTDRKLRVRAAVQDGEPQKLIISPATPAIPLTPNELLEFRFQPGEERIAFIPF